MSQKYREAALKLQQNVQKHLNKIDDMSSEEEEPYEYTVLEGVLESYKSSGGDIQMLKRTKNLLEEVISGRSVTCLICIGSIKRADPIWSCVNCYSYFHLTCIQKWSNDCVSLKNLDEGALSVCRPKSVEWCCPKCRFAYHKDNIPRKYRCFCGKTDNPPLHPWLIPHSCGEVCLKKLSEGDYCKHKCLLLCHPGPCPPCPQTINGPCHCEKQRKRVRCSLPKWSCSQPCNKTLKCGSHRCENICHEGECPPCNYTSLQSCLCGLETVKRPCNDTVWQCMKVCDKPFSCGYHKCDRICHSGDCGICPNSGLVSCPCGAQKQFVQCPDTIDTCMSTCGKKHEGCDHNCPEKCHKGPCPPCQVLIEKKCQCGAHARQLPCSKEYRCDVKCRGIRSCGKHGCGRKCCNGNCPPCEKICDKPLQCGRHKCTSICHNGPCYPCSRDSKVTCRCKETYITVPCGREKHAKPPKCYLPCKIKYKCGHTAENKHLCHFGDCPPCKAICDKAYDKCSHRCKAVCHENVAVVFKQTEKPATPWEKQAPKTKIMALECNPCVEPITIICFGEHETFEQPCHAAKRISCGRKCSRPLPCGNHTCTIICHLIASDPKYPGVPYKCEPCHKECTFPRPKECTHKCAINHCHPGPCPPCVVLEKIKCHCKLTEIYLKCKELAAATEQMLSCQQQCPKNLECGHRCKNLCHSGLCKDQVCTKKTKVYCNCGSIKKEFACNLVRSGKVDVACDETCEQKKLNAEIEKRKEEQRLRELEEERNRRELAEYEWKLSGKKKKYKEKKHVVKENNKNFISKYWIVILSGFCVIFGITFAVYSVV